MSTTLNQLTDNQLEAEVKRLAATERRITAELIAYLSELDARRLYLAAGFSSLFTYCCGELRLSESEAYNRIEAARAARKHPRLLDLLRDGSLNLTTVRLLAPHLTEENQSELLAGARGKSKREVEELLARHAPQPAVPASVRKLPAPRETSAAAAPVAAAPCVSSSLPDVAPRPPRQPVVAPLSAENYRITFTANVATREKLRQAQDLLRHAIPSGDVAEVIDRALTLLLQDLARKKLAATQRPRASVKPKIRSRHIPSAVRRTVWLRDGGRCAFTSHAGRRCEERAFLEFHHVDPYGLGGEASVDKIELRCRAHNQYEAELFFGPRKVASRTRPGTSSGGNTRGSAASDRAEALVSR